MYTIAWLLFILAIIAAVPIAALIDAQQRKKAQREAMMADEGQGDEGQGEAEQAYDDADDIVVADDAEDVADDPFAASPLDGAVPVAEADDSLFGDVLPK